MQYVRTEEPHPNVGGEESAGLDHHAVTMATLQ